MRTCNKNKQKLWYSLQTDAESTYVTDDNGNVIYDDIDGELIPRKKHKSNTVSYTIPEVFYGNIHTSGGQAQANEYGVSVADYDAVLYIQKDSIGLNETSLIWFQNEPKYKDEDETIVDPASADYVVRRVPPCLDERIYLLKRVDK